MCIILTLLGIYEMIAQLCSYPRYHCRYRITLVHYLQSGFYLYELSSSSSFIASFNNNSHSVRDLFVLIYERKNKPCFSLELSHIQFINYSLHIVDIFHISCHDISIVITSLVTRTTHIFSNTMCRALLLIIACVYRHLTVF
jgi:hypothetical protein